MTRVGSQRHRKKKLLSRKYISRPTESSSPSYWSAALLKIRTVSCPEMSVAKYYTSSHKVPKEQRPQV